MKKTALGLIVCLMMQLLTGMFAQAADSGQAVAGLQTLGVLYGSDVGLELERPVTRAEAVAFLDRLLYREELFDDEEEPFFSDVWPTHWAYQSIQSFAARGDIAGTGDGLFTPERQVTTGEFLTILLNDMGYDATPLTALQLARAAGILSAEENIAAEKPMIREDAVRVCFAALTADLPDGEKLYQLLIEADYYTQEEMDAVLRLTKTEFADHINRLMPEDKNYMISPFSLKMAMAMAANGADGETRQEILDTLGIEDLDAYNAYAKDLIALYGSADVLTLDVANSIWINKSRALSDFNETFENLMQINYNAKTGVVENTNAVDAVNGWVKEKTREKISGIIDSNAFLYLLVNAVYFNGTWEDEFSPSNTQKETFYSRDGSSQQIDFMGHTKYMAYAIKDGLTMVKLPYKHSTVNREKGETDVKQQDFSVSMYVMMGDAPFDPVQTIESTELQYDRVSLRLPKFKMEYQENMNDAFHTLGVSRAFENNAQFQKLADGDFKITDILHKTYVNVDEKGTEAAAVTAIAVGATALPNQPIPIRFDRPFTFVIYDDTNHEALFVGEYAFAE